MMESEKLVEINEGIRLLLRDSTTSTKADIFKDLPIIPQKQVYKCMFDFYKAAVVETGEDRSFYTTDFAEVLRKFQQWKDELPNVQMFYAVKANPDPLLLRFVVILGISFDCATEDEIKAALAAGATPDRIIFANPNITPTGLKYAKKVGVNFMTFDSEESLHRICKIYPSARLLLRICPTVVNCSFDFREKFGCRIDKSLDLLKEAKRLKMNIVGASFHVGSLNTQGATFASAIQDVSRIFESAQVLGFDLKILDIGGGFLGSIGTDQLFKNVARRIRESLIAIFPSKDVLVMAEPGCYVISSAVTLTTNIFSKRTASNETELPDGETQTVERQYFLNNSVYSSFSRGIEEYGIFCEPLLKRRDLRHRPSYQSTLFGQTLCSSDVLKRDILLPDMRIGESLIWRNMGAYSQSMCSTFCSFPLPDSKYVFKIDHRVKTDGIKNLDEMKKFILEHLHIVVNEDHHAVTFFE